MVLAVVSCGLVEVNNNVFEFSQAGALAPFAFNSPCFINVIILQVFFNKCCLYGAGSSILSAFFLYSSFAGYPDKNVLKFCSASHIFPKPQLCRIMILRQRVLYSPPSLFILSSAWMDS
jgi:hypothetical protein